MPKIGIIAGSIRDGSQSERIGEYAASVLQAEHADVDVELFPLRELQVPLWQEDKWTKTSTMSEDWKPLSERLKACSGFVIIAPEWAGMAPPHLKNFLLMCDGGELAHKPAQLIAISSGMGGAYPIAELRMSGYKNNYLMWLPDHMILRNVTSLFVEEKPTELDTILTARMNYGLNFLVETATAIAPIREKLQDLKTYPNGM